MRWSPMRMVFSIEPLGITRAWTSVPSMKTNARITQNHERSSRLTFWPGVSTGCGFALPFSFFVFSLTTMGLHFQLHQFGGIASGVARRAELAVRVLDGGAQVLKRKITEGIGADEFANFFNRIVRGDQFEFRGRVHAVMAGRHGGRTTDAHVDFGGAGVAHHAHDFAAGGAANDGIIHEHDALAF